MKHFKSVLLGVALLYAMSASAQTVLTNYPAAGSYTYTVPRGVTEITVKAWGGGGGGGAAGTVFIFQ